MVVEAMSRDTRDLLFFGFGVLVGTVGVLWGAWLASWLS